MKLLPHNHPIRTIWNSTVLLGILTFLFVITYRVVFGTFVPDTIYYVLIGLFTLDIGINFITRVKKGHRRYDTLPEVARYYLRTWFFLDFIAAFPTELVLVALFGPLHPDSPFWGIYLILQLLTLVKLLKVGRIFSELQEALGLIPAVQRLLLFGYWLLATIHLIALGWILIGAGERDRSSADQYLRALYWATTTISTIGYGDYTPDHNSNNQIAYTILIQLFGVGMFSYVIANVSSLMSNLDVAKTAYRRRLDEINAFLYAQKIPSDLQNRVRDYYSYLWEQQRGVSSIQLLNDFPRSISQEILLFLNKEVLDRVELFRGANELFIREAVQLLRPEVFIPGEYIIRQGEYGDCMYFLTSGEVKILVDGAEVARLGPGTFFGETALMENIHRNATVIALEYCTGYRLARSDFDGLRSKYPEFNRQVQTVVAGRKR